MTLKFRGKGSIYALDEKTKDWLDRGSGGSIFVYQNPQHIKDVSIKWQKNNRIFWWKLTKSKYKEKGERALIIKAWTKINNKHEILAIRFTHKLMKEEFMQIYLNIFSDVLSPQNNNINNNKKKHHRHNLSIVQLPSVMLDDNYQQHPPQQQYVQNNQKRPPQLQQRYSNNRPRPPSPPKKKHHPRPPPPIKPMTVKSHGNILSNSKSNSKFKRGLPKLNGMDYALSAPQQRKPSKPPVYAKPGMKPPPIFNKNKNKNNQINVNIINISSWKCGVCTYLNGSSLHCAMCGVNRNNKVTSDDDDDDIYDKQQKWRCRQCTYGNSLCFDRCEICSAKRYIDDCNTHDIRKEWSCPSCTLLNQYNADKCAACGVTKVIHDNDYKDPFNHADNSHNSYNNGSVQSTQDDFSRAISDIAFYNSTPLTIFSTLKSVSKKLLKDDIRYRTLDTTNPRVMERLIGFEGVLDFLMLLGFESDAIGCKLICKYKPLHNIVKNAINVLNLYIDRFSMTQIGYKKNSKTSGNSGFINNDNNQNNDILTLEQIILWSTHENMSDNYTMETLIMTHKTFTDSITLLKQLRKRFFVPIPTDILNGNTKMTVDEFQHTIQKRIQLKSIKALRDWMKKYWYNDFMNNELMINELKEWLHELAIYKDDPFNQNCGWIDASYKAVKREFARLKVIDWKKENKKKYKNLFLLNKLNNIKIPNKYNIWSLSAEDLAHQITLINYYLFAKIEPRECVHRTWLDNGGNSDKSVIGLLIKQFNSFTLFIQIMILHESSLRRRALSIKRFIKMGEEFRLLRNYHSLCAVFSALSSAAINRLKLAWKRVPDRSIRIFEEWKPIFSHEFNHRVYRGLLRKTGGNPCIPHIGIFLKDLEFINCGNKSKKKIINLGNNEILNFNKCVRISDRINNLKLFQKSNGYIKLKKQQNNYLKVSQKVLLQEFAKLHFTENEIWDMSTEIKKQDLKEAKKAMKFQFSFKHII